MRHDQLFKDLLRAFLPEFLALFFPEAAARLDFGRVEYLDKEVFADLGEGARHEADLVAKVGLLEGGEELVLVHVEVEARHRASFPARMFDYYSLLRLRYRQPIYPVTVYLAPGAGGLTRETYEESTLDQAVLRFSYAAVGLPDLQADEYLELDNPLAPALASLMQPSRLGRALQKALGFRRAASLPVDEARKSLLMTVVERYVILNEDESQEFERLSQQPEMQEAVQMVNVFEERGMERGMARGMEAGRQQGALLAKRETLLKLLAARFGTVPGDTAEAIRLQESTQRLDDWCARVLTAGSVADVGIQPPPTAA